MELTGALATCLMSRGAERDGAHFNVDYCGVGMRDVVASIQVSCMASLHREVVSVSMACSPVGQWSVGVSRMVWGKVGDAGSDSGAGARKVLRLCSLGCATRANISLDLIIWQISSTPLACSPTLRSIYSTVTLYQRDSVGVRHRFVDIMHFELIVPYVYLGNIVRQIEDPQSAISGK